MLPAWMRPFPLHLGRGKPIQIDVEGYPSLDELHEGHFLCHVSYVGLKGWRTFRAIQHGRFPPRTPDLP